VLLFGFFSNASCSSFWISSSIVEQPCQNSNFVSANINLLKLCHTHLLKPSSIVSHLLLGLFAQFDLVHPTPHSISAASLLLSVTPLHHDGKSTLESSFSLTSISGDSSTVVVATIGTTSDTIVTTIATIGTTRCTIGTFFTFTLCWTGAACRCELHVVFAFHLHVSCSKAILAPGLVLLFEDAGRQAVQVHGHTVVIVPDVEVPVVANHLLVATLVLRLPRHVIAISLPLVWLAMDAGKQDESAEVEENHPAGGLQE